LITATFVCSNRVSPPEKGRDVFATLYAKRMFFFLVLQVAQCQFEVIPLMDARHYASRTWRGPAADGRRPPPRAGRQLFSTRPSC